MLSFSEKSCKQSAPQIGAVSPNFCDLLNILVDWQFMVLRRSGSLLPSLQCRRGVSPFFHIFPGPTEGDSVFVKTVLPKSQKNSPVRVFIKNFRDYGSKLKIEAGFTFLRNQLHCFLCRPRFDCRLHFLLQGD